MQTILLQPVQSAVIPTALHPDKQIKTQQRRVEIRRATQTSALITSTTGGECDLQLPQ
jgi:hypothetical protein